MRKGSGVFGGGSRLGESSFSKTGRVSIVYDSLRASLRESVEGQEGPSNPLQERGSPGKVSVTEIEAHHSRNVGCDCCHEKQLIG